MTFINSKVLIACIMGKDKALVVFQDKKIRRVWHNDEWFYSVTDIIAVLTDSLDESAYWRQLKVREPQLVTICHGLKLIAKDCKLRYADCVRTKEAFRLIQSIPSKKAEPFNLMEYYLPQPTHLPSAHWPEMNSLCNFAQESNKGI